MEGFVSFFILHSLLYKPIYFYIPNFFLCTHIHTPHPSLALPFPYLAYLAQNSHYINWGTCSFRLFCLFKTLIKVTSFTYVKWTWTNTIFNHPSFAMKLHHTNGFVYLLNLEIYLQNIKGKSRCIMHILCGS